MINDHIQLLAMPIVSYLLQHLGKWPKTFHFDKSTKFYRLGLIFSTSAEHEK